MMMLMTSWRSFSKADKACQTFCCYLLYHLFKSSQSIAHMWKTKLGEPTVLSTAVDGVDKVDNLVDPSYSKPQSFQHLGHEACFHWHSLLLCTPLL